MTNDEKTYEAKTRNIGLKNLFLDPNNYRLINEPEYEAIPEDKITDSQVTRRTFRLLAGDRDQHIRDLIDSFRANGYLPVDQIQVREIESGKYVVVEGNRRIADMAHNRTEQNNMEAT